MSGKPCSTKSKNSSNEKYVCDPITGRWKLKSEFRKCSDNVRYTDHSDLYECNPATFRWRLKPGARALPRVPRTKCNNKSKFAKDIHYECGEDTDFRWVLRDKYKKIRADGAPKRPLSSYMLWAKENREKFTSVGKKASEVAKAMGVAWKGLPSNIKNEYKEIADAEMETYQEKLKARQEPIYSIIDKPKIKRTVNQEMLNWKRKENERLKKQMPEETGRTRRNIVNANWHKHKQTLPINNPVHLVAM